MKTTILAICFGIVLLLKGCDKQPQQSQLPTFSEPTDLNLKYLTSEFLNWQDYEDVLHLSGEFTAVDVNGEQIEKGIFLDKLASGDFLPIKMNAENAEVYQLYQMPISADESVVNTVAFTAETLKFYYDMEGEELPPFEWETLEGQVLTNKDLDGKTALVKTWFIQCVACIEEFPELNHLVAKYQDENDILFISLALDQAPALNKFLAKKPFSYQVVADQGDYINNQLGLNGYPTHLVVKDGKVVRVTNSATQMIKELDALKN